MYVTYTIATKTFQCRCVSIARYLWERKISLRLWTYEAMKFGQALSFILARCSFVSLDTVKTTFYVPVFRLLCAAVLHTFLAPFRGLWTLSFSLKAPMKSYLFPVICFTSMTAVSYLHVAKSRLILLVWLICILSIPFLKQVKEATCWEICEKIFDLCVSSLNAH